MSAAGKPVLAADSEWRGHQVIIGARVASSPVTLAAREPRADRVQLCWTHTHLASSIKNPVAPCYARSSVTA